MAVRKTSILLLAMLGWQVVVAKPMRIDDSHTGKQLDLPIYEWVDKAKRHKGNIVAVHGLTLYAASWDNFAKHLAARGYRVFALDQRGFGRWQKDGAKFNGNNKIEIGQSQQDLLDLMTTLRQAYPKQKFFMLGESLGANMSLSLICEHPDLADGAILVSLCYKARMHPKPLYWMKDFAEEVIKPGASLNLTPYAAPYLTNDPVVAAACNSDPLINRRMTPAELVKVDILDDRAISQAKNLPSKYPLFLISGSRDAMFKSKDLAELVDKLKSKNISLQLLMGKGHLLLEHQKVDPQIAALIDAWLAKQIKQVLSNNVRRNGDE